MTTAERTLLLTVARHQDGIATRRQLRDALAAVREEPDDTRLHELEAALADIATIARQHPALTLSRRILAVVDATKNPAGSAPAGQVVQARFGASIAS